tara:strand:- start:808 stop:1365 length:558 start_codon:yes stop_codon:yes gene_type:complete
MKLIIGLGNPGTRYMRTRHNAGFMAIDLVASEFNNTKWQKKFESLISFQTIQQTKVILLKPLTYMNLSGIAAQTVLNFYKIAMTDTVIFHDDIDLPLGTVKLKIGGGHAGHNGLRSINEAIGQNYIRVRIGVSRPKEDGVANYVLGNFLDEEEIILNQSLSKCYLGIKHLIKDEHEKCRKIFSTD